MVLGCPSAVYDPRPPLSVDRSISHDTFVIDTAYVGATRTRDEKSTGSQDLEGPEIEFLIGAACRWNCLSRPRKRGWIQDDGIELSPLAIVGA